MVWSVYEINTSFAGHIGRCHGERSSIFPHTAPPGIGNDNSANSSVKVSDVTRSIRPFAS